jgi:hypothetical protein
LHALARSDKGENNRSKRKPNQYQTKTSRRKESAVHFDARPEIEHKQPATKTQLESCSQMKNRVNQAHTKLVTWPTLAASARLNMASAAA